MFPMTFHKHNFWQLKATHVRPREDAFALTDLKATADIFSEFDPNSDDFASTWRHLLIVVGSPLLMGRMSLGFYPLAKMCFLSSPISIILQVACSRSHGSSTCQWWLELCGWWICSRGLPQVLSATTSNPLPHQRRWRWDMESKIYGDDIKCPYFLADIQHALIKFDGSQFFIHMESKT